MLTRTISRLEFLVFTGAPQGGKFFCNSICSSLIDWRAKRRSCRSIFYQRRGDDVHIIRFVDSIGQNFTTRWGKNRYLFFFYEFAAALRIYAPCAQARKETADRGYLANGCEMKKERRIMGAEKSANRSVLYA